MRKLKAYAFDNMVGVPNETQSAILRVELECAGITSLLQMPYGEPQATISGIMVFKSGQTMVLHRSWIYWSAWLIKPLPLEAALALHDKQGRFVRPDGHADSPRPTTSVDHYNIDTQDGLNALVTAVKTEFGEVVTDTSCDAFKAGMISVNKLGVAEPLTALSEHERDVTNVNSLLAFARWQPREDYRLSILFQALFTVEKLFPGKRKWTAKVSNELARFYRERVRKAKDRLSLPNHQPGDLMWAKMGIERDQRARAKYLRVVGHTSNAKACHNDAVAMRPEIIELLSEHRDYQVAMLKGKTESEHDHYWSRVAFMEFMLGRFNRMIGEHKISREHFAECRRIQSLLSTEHFKGQLTSWVKLWH